MLNRILTNQIELDFLPVAERKIYHEMALKRLLQHAFVHPLTRDRFSGINERDLRWGDPTQVLRQISAISSMDHTSAVLGNDPYRDYVSSESNSPIVFSTGGTTGRPKILVNSYDETLQNAVFHGKGYFSAGIRQTDTVATFGGSGTYASEYCVYHALSQTGCTIVPINDFQNTEENISILQSLNVNTILAMPSELFALVEHLEGQCKKLDNVARIVTGGEKLSAQLQSRLRACLSKNVAFGSTFQTADLGTIGYQCSSCQPGEYHIHEELQYAQIANNAEDEDVLVLTNLHRFHMPVLRIYSGDIVSWADQDGICTCGRTSRKIVIEGRTSDMVKIGGEKISSSIFVQIPEVFDLPENQMRIEISTSKSGRDLITIFSDQVLGSGLEEVIVSHLMSDTKLAQMKKEQRFETVVFRRFSDIETSVVGAGKFRVLKDIR